MKSVSGDDLARPRISQAWTYFFLILVLFVQLALAKSSAAPRVTLEVGTILKGTADLKNGIASWRGELTYGTPSSNLFSDLSH